MKELIRKNEIVISVIEIDVLDMGHMTNTYIIYDDNAKNGILVDPCYNGHTIIEEIEKKGINLNKIYITHCHGDHIGALEEIYQHYLSRGEKLEILIHENDRESIFDDDKNCKYILSIPNFINLNLDDISSVKEKDIVSVDSINLEVIHTPGHTNGCTILYEPVTNSLITGDTIFSDCYGRVDLKTGSIKDMKNSIDKVFNRFDDIIIYPGHGNSCNLNNVKRRINLLLAIKGK